jgi:hypothetical protein
MARDTKDLIGFISIQVFHMSGNSIDADQRLTRDLEKLTADLSGLLTGMVKPSSPERDLWRTSPTIWPTQSTTTLGPSPPTSSPESERLLIM